MTTYTDDFNRADGALGSPWTDIGGDSALTIVSNRADLATGSEAIMRYDSDLATVDHSCDVYYTTPTSGAYYPAPCVRHSSSAQTCYRLYLNDGNITLTRVVAGSGTDLASTAVSWTTNVTYRLVLEVTGSGSTVSLVGRMYQSDGTTLMGTVTYDDTSVDRLTTGTRTGLYVYQTTNTGGFDNFTAADISSGTTHTATAALAGTPVLAAAAVNGVLTTLRPDGDGTFVNWTGGFANIDDDPDSPNTADVATNTGGVDGSGFYTLEAAPTNYNTLQSISVKVHSRGSAGATVDIFVQLYAANEVTAITNEVLVKRHTTADWSTNQVWLTPSTTIDKATIDAARLRLRADVI